LQYTRDALLHIDTKAKSAIKKFVLFGSYISFTMAEESKDIVGTHQERSTNTEDTADAFGTIGGGAATGTGAIGQLANGYQYHGANGSANYHKFTARMTTDRHAAEYNMRHKNRGELKALWRTIFFMNHDREKAIKAV